MFFCQHRIHKIRIKMHNVDQSNLIVVDFNLSCVSFSTTLNAGSAWLLRRNITSGFMLPLQWRHNGRDGVSIYQRFVCLPNRLFRHRSKKTSSLRVTGLCEGNSLVTVEFSPQRANDVKNVSIWWRHRAFSRVNNGDTQPVLSTKLIISNIIRTWCHITKR